MSDGLLTQIGIARALRSMAAIAADLHEWEAALNWNRMQGFIVFTGQRGADGTPEFRLTERGASAVYLFWKAYLVGRAAHRGENVDESEWGQGRDGEHITIDLSETDPKAA